MLDIDKFKNINDTYGHSIGDIVLVELSNILQKSLRKSDLICRYGGEEFVALLPDTNTENAMLVAEEIRKTIEEHKMVQDAQTIKCTVSLGVSEINISKDKTIEQVLNRADKALYKAKDAGRNRVVLLNKGTVY
jgi:diguanylate cyclase (GGDEF)-like protein